MVCRAREVEPQIHCDSSKSGGRQRRGASSRSLECASKLLRPGHGGTTSGLEGERRQRAFVHPFRRELRLRFKQLLRACRASSRLYPRDCPPARKHSARTRRLKARLCVFRRPARPVRTPLANLAAREDDLLAASIVRRKRHQGRVPKLGGLPSAPKRDTIGPRRDAGRLRIRSER